ncbi:MAG: M48 family metalloprotease [Candidatus Omnitrophota bacterium]
MKRHSLFLIISIVVVFTQGCASTNIANITDVQQFQQDDDEKGIWHQSKEMEYELRNSGFLYPDQDLADYVNRVLKRLVADIEEKHQVNLRAYIIQDPYFNAFVLPNGAMFIHTGLIATLENEAQLATILGHESVHFLNRHSLRQQRSVINKSAFFSFFQMTTAGLGDYGSLARIYGELAVMGTIYGYSRDLEREADQQGYELMLKAGYDPFESKKAFELLYESIKDEKKKIPYFFSTHPKVKERIVSFEKLLANLKNEAPPKFKGEAEYVQHVGRVLLDNARLSLKCNKLEQALKQIERFLKAEESSPEAILLQGQIYALQNKPDEARDLFSAMLRDYPDYSPVYREIGLMVYKDKEYQESNQYFKRYLELSPNAEDANYIRGYIHE